MSIATTDRKAGPFLGDDVTTEFPFEFKVYDAEHLKVILTSSSGFDKELALDTDYTVSLNADQEDNPGGKVALVSPLAAGQKLTIITDQPATQEAVLTNMGGFFPKTIEKQLDWLTILVQQLTEKVNRSLKFSVTDPQDEVDTIPPVENRAGKYLAFDAAGRPFMSAGTGSDVGLRQDLTNAATGEEGTRLVSDKYEKAGAVAVHLHDYIEDNGAYNVMGFIPQNLKRRIREHTSLDDVTQYVQSAMDVCGDEGRVLFFPRGRFNVAGALSTAKPRRLWMRGERATYFDSKGTVLRWVGSSGYMINVGVADGNPDITGKTLDFRLSDMALEYAGTGADGAINVVNTSFAWLKRVMTRFYPGRVINLEGGNVLSKIEDCEISGAGDVAGNYGIFMGDYQFGNFVTHIRNNHIYALKYAIRCSEGRYLDVADNTIEGIHGDIYVFETDGYISHARFSKNYHEEAGPGYAFKGANFSGLILKLSLLDNEFWGYSGGVTGFGDFSKDHVLEHETRGNWIVTESRNSIAGLGLPSVYPDTKLFTDETSIANDDRVNQEYIDKLTWELGRSDRELLGLAGDMNGLDGEVVPDTINLQWDGGQPHGWDPGPEALSRTWRMVRSPRFGWEILVDQGGSAFVLAERIINLPGGAKPVTRFFVGAYTFRGWGALLMDRGAGTEPLFDNGASEDNPKTALFKFTVPPNQATVKLQLARNAGNISAPIELRLWEIGTAEYNLPGVGSLGNALHIAVARNLKKGYHFTSPY